MNLNIVEDSDQETSRVEEKILRKHNQKSRGRNIERGKGFPNKWGRNPKDEAEGSSNQVNQRGGFIGGRGRGKNREVKCYTCGEIEHMSWECPKNKPTAHRNVNIVSHEDSNEEGQMNNPRDEG